MGWKKLLGEKLDTILADGKLLIWMLKKLHSPFLPLATLLTTVKKKMYRPYRDGKLLIWMLKNIAQPISATSDIIDNS